MRAHRLVRSLLPGVFVGYVLLGFASTLTPHREVFPFFSWFLFPLTPNESERFQVVLDEVHGRQLPEPLAYEAAESWVNSRSVDAQVVVQRLGLALEKGEGNVARDIRRLFEGRFLHAPCRYRIVARRFDPLLALEGHADASRRTVGEFRCGNGTGKRPPAMEAKR